RTTHLRLGIVGPSARGHEVQDAWHKFIGVDRFNGWDNQLRDEPVVQLVHERMRRYPLPRIQLGRGWEQDLISHGGGALGNLATYANAGAEWRIGWNLPDDFGSTPLRPAGENTAPTQTGTHRNAWAGHGFLTFDARLIAHDITLDGNTFRSSHSVDRRVFVADIGYGIAVTRGGWKFAIARYYRTREFNGQRERPVFGSFTVSKAF
ncbi:lipid A deacylase LpxR family protein, partial [Pseudomonas helleri]